MADPTLEPVGEYTKITNTPTGQHANTPIRFSFPSNVGIVRVFYRTLPLHKGVIADYNL